MLRASLAFTLCIALSQVCAAADLGVEGNTWSITETDMRRVAAEQASKVDWAKVQDKLKAGAKEFTRNLPKRDLPSVAVSELKWVDPSITLQSDIQVPVKRPDGSWRWDVLYRKGYRFNPLSVQRPITAMLFVDTASEAQQKLVQRVLELEPVRVQVVEAGRGDVGLASKALNRPVFYANDALLSRFKVAHTPALVFVNSKGINDKVGVLALAPPYRVEDLSAWEVLAEKMKDMHESR